MRTDLRCPAVSVKSTPGRTQHDVTTPPEMIGVPFPLASYLVFMPAPR